MDLMEEFFVAYCGYMVYCEKLTGHKLIVTLEID